MTEETDIIALAERAKRDPIAEAELTTLRLRRFERDADCFPHNGAMEEKALARDVLLSDLHSRIPESSRPDALRVLEEKGIMTAKEAERELKARAKRAAEEAAIGSQSAKEEGPRKDTQKGGWVQFWDHPNLVDVVQEASGALKFWLHTGEGYSLQDRLGINGKEVAPPPATFYDVPTTDSLGFFEENDKELFSEVVAFIRGHVQMPRDPEKVEYEILAAWVLHSFLVERFDASPYLYFHGAFESGKSRASSVLKALTRHGISTVGLTGPALFRANEFYRPAFFIDELHLAKESSDTLDLLNARYKRGARVCRVNTDKSGPDSLETFEVFGPTVISTTAGIPQTLASRSITFSMLTNSRPVADRVDLAAAAILRDRLTAFRARHFRAELPKPSRQPYSGRLREIITPLHQMILLGCPNAEVDFLRYVGEVGASQKAELQGDFDFEVVKALLAVRDSIRDGRIEVRTVTDAVNGDRESSDTVEAWKVGQALKKLGFGAVARHGGGRARYVEMARLHRLAVKFGLGGEAPDTPSQASPPSQFGLELPKILDDNTNAGTVGRDGMGWDGFGREQVAGPFSR